MLRPVLIRLAGVLAAGLMAVATPLFAQQSDAPWLQDRGPGLATSMFGTYIARGQWIVYPFFEYYRDNAFDYTPAEFGYALDQDFQGKYRASEGILFVAYGITDRLAIELEGAVIDATLTTASGDASGIPARINESGGGDVEGQLHYRWLDESAGHPELFSYFEAVSPQQTEKPLTGTPDWEFAFGSGVTRGFGWGTMTLRASVDYSVDGATLDVGEFAVEYLRRLSPHWRLYAGVEGSPDEASLITEAQWHLGRSVVIKLNNGVGLTSSATDWAPEVGVMFFLGGR